MSRRPPRAAGRDGSERITIREVAAAAGVGIATASRALNGSSHVTDETRQKVEAAARQLGFRHNALARGLSRGRAGMVGILLSDIRSPYLAEVLFRAESRFRELGFGIVIADTANSVNVLSATEGLRYGRIDGLLSLLPMTPEEVAAFPCPIVFGDRPLNDHGHDELIFDNRSGGEQMALHLQAVGCRRLVVVDSPETPATRTRLEGFMGGVTTATVRVLKVEERGIRGGRSAAQRLLAERRAFDGIFATNDMLAIGLIQDLAAARRRIPEDVAVGGFDGSWVSTICAPPLTTIIQDAGGLGAQAANLLVRRIEERAGGLAITPTTTVLPVTLVTRGSTIPQSRSA